MTSSLLGGIQTPPLPLKWWRHLWTAPYTTNTSKIKHKYIKDTPQSHQRYTTNTSQKCTEYWDWKIDICHCESHKKLFSQRRSPVASFTPPVSNTCCNLSTEEMKMFLLLTVDGSPLLYLYGDSNINTFNLGDHLYHHKMGKCHVN